MLVVSELKTKVKNNIVTVYSLVSKHSDNSDTSG